MCEENTVLPGLSHKISQVNCWYCAFFLLRIHLLLLLIVYDASFAIKLVIQKSRRKKSAKRILRTKNPFDVQSPGQNSEL